MPILFAFTPAILFQGKPTNVDMGPLPDEAFFADITQVFIEEGTSFAVGDQLSEIRTDSGVHPVLAKKQGIAQQVNIRTGGMIEEGASVLIGEIPATGVAVFSSMFSAFLGTIAFSALTMMYWLRRTNLLEWLLLAAATVFLYWPTWLTDGAGVLLVAIVLWLQQRKNQQTSA